MRFRLSEPEGECIELLYNVSHVDTDDWEICDGCRHVLSLDS